MSQAIIVPLDGSELSERALPWAAELARLTDRTLTLLQVLPWERRSPEARRGILEISDKLRAELRDAALAYLDRLGQQLVARGVDTFAEVAYGQDVASAILDVADELGAGAIVLASHGHGGLTRFMIGSVAQRVAQQSLVPTLIVRTSGKQPEHVSFEKLLVPLDGSSFAESGLELVNDIGGRASEIILARIVEPVRVATGTSAELGSVIDWRATQEASYQAESYLSEQANALARAGLKVQGLVCTGNPDAELCRIADGRSIDLIIMSTHGRTGFNRFLFGSTTDALLRHASQPVLLINSRARSARSLEPYTVSDVYRRDGLHYGLTNRCRSL
jgi:nucleotide-binding universal stress UspA family protein